MTPALVIHGGAWAIPDAEVDAHRDAMERALALGRARLDAGASALDVVVAVVSWLEDNPALDAGLGAVLNHDGEVELDAGIMDGATLDFGAVAAAQRIRHPIVAARTLLERGQRQASLLAGRGADRWAEAQGLEVVDPSFFVVERERARFEALRERERWHTSVAFRGERAPGDGTGASPRDGVGASPGDGAGGSPGDDAMPRDTVGCVARDATGRIVAGTSTGGAPYTVPGRVGDSPLPGCGYYATPHAGASATGWGEAIARVLMCSVATLAVESGAVAHAAAEAAVARLGTIRDPDGHAATGGIIVLAREGAPGLAYSSPRMARAWWSTAGEGVAV